MRASVLQVIPSLVGGGAERQLVELAAALTRAGVSVHLAYLHGGPNLEPARLSGATLHQLPASGNHDPRVLLALRALIRQLQPAVVQTWILHADVFGGLAAKSCGVPWLLCERSSAAMYASGAKFRLRRWLGRMADGVAANSDGGLSYWRDAGFRGLGQVIRNIVRMPSEALPAALCVEAQAPHVVAVGRLSEEKNYPLLLDALELVFQRHPDAHASILGEGAMRPELEARIAGSPSLAGRVSLPGYVPDVGQRLAAASVYVSLSRFEGTPNTVLEAIVNGCPLVLSDIPAHREWLSNDEAQWVSPDNPERVADAMVSALARPQTRGAQLVDARTRLQAWSADRIAAQYIALYQQLNPRRIACVSS